MWPKDNIFFFIKVDLICCQINIKLTLPDILIEMFNYQIIYIYYTHTKKKKKTSAVIGGGGNDKST